MFRKYVDTFRIDCMLLPHCAPDTIALNNIFGGESARRLQPQDSITLFLYPKSHRKTTSVSEVKGIERGQEGSSWCLAVIAVNDSCGIPSEKDDYTCNLTNSSRECISLRESQWETYVVPAILKDVERLSRDIKKGRKVRTKGSLGRKFACVRAGPASSMWLDQNAPTILLTSPYLPLDKKQIRA